MLSRSGGGEARETQQRGCNPPQEHQIGAPSEVTGKNPVAADSVSGFESPSLMMERSKFPGASELIRNEVGP